MRTIIKKFGKTEFAGVDNPDDSYKAATSVTDRTRSKGPIKTNKAAHDRSCLSARYAK